MSATALDLASTRGRDVMFASGMVVILAILFLPVPTLLIDFGLAVSIALSVLVLLVSLWISRPLDFTSFPTILLVATMLRLSMNVATTRAILSDGHEGVNAAGRVIGGFSQFVMAGDFVIGLTVFAILVVVNFVVITKGSTRIAEVGARFTLDAIPGKQMSIDADLSAGAIDDAEARHRRQELEEESAFYGAMDGASKFVRGDAVAGLAITAINIVGGIVIGTTRHGMDFASAAEVFVKLSVGDGLVSQIPALVVSLAAGLIVSKGRTPGSADQAVFRQLGAHPKALRIAGALLIAFSLAPGLPFVPFAALAAGAFVLAGVVARSQAVQPDLDAVEAPETDAVAAPTLHPEDLELQLGSQLSAQLAANRSEIARRMARLRERFAREYGFVVPDVMLSENLEIAPKSYRILVQGAPAGGYEMRLGDVLALIGDRDPPDLPGEVVREPAYGIRAFATSPAFRKELENQSLRVADEIATIMTHLGEVVRTNLSQLLSYRDMKRLIAGLDEDSRALAEATCTTHLGYPELQAVLRLLLAERVSIRNLPQILEAVAEVAPHLRRAERIAEHVRMRIAPQLCGDLAPEGRLAVLRMGGEWEAAFASAIVRDAGGEVVNFAMEPADLERFGRAASSRIRSLLSAGRRFALVTSPDQRVYVRMIVERLHPNIAVLSHNEIARGLSLDVIGEIEHTAPEPSAPLEPA